jgi:pimeloyl-ACP methyl ester carboxylesterase
MAVLADVTSDPLTRFTNGLQVSTAPGWTEENPEIVKEWTEWRVANPLDLAGYQSQMAIGLALVAEEAAFEHRLPSVSVPTMIIFGAHDKVVPPENANLLAKQISGSQITIIPDAGHFFCIEAPEAASNIIIDLLK